MVTINVFGKTEPICISEKLKLYVSNIPNAEDDNWNQYIFEELQQAVAIHNYGGKHYIDAKALHDRLCPHSVLDTSVIETDYLHDIVDNMLCVYLDYTYEDMPLGDWKTNPFDGRCCEKDYSELLVDFFHFLSFLVESPSPSWTYSSNYDHSGHFHRFFLRAISFTEAINSLKTLGQIVDSFLNSRNDYLQFDYLVRAIHDADQYDTYHFFKLYSLCQLFLENEKESELDRKLPIFLDEQLPESERNQIAKIMRQMRNKIAHGDFVAFEEKVEEYATYVLDNKYDFDYAEYSRKNWVLLNACCKLTEAVKRIIEMLFTNPAKLQQIKKST